MTDETIITDVPAPKIDEENGVQTETFTVKSKDAVDILQYINEPDIRLGVDRRKRIEFKMPSGDLVCGIIRPLSVDESTEINQYASVNGVSADKLVLQRAFYGMDGKTHIPDLVLEKMEAGICSKIVTEIMAFTGFGDDEDLGDELKKS